MAPKRASSSGSGQKSALQLAKEEAKRALEQRASHRTTTMKASMHTLNILLVTFLIKHDPSLHKLQESPSPGKKTTRKSSGIGAESSPAAARPAATSTVAARRRSSLPAPAPMEIGTSDEEEEEEEEVVKPENKVHTRVSAPAARRRSSAAAVSPIAKSSTTRKESESGKKRTASVAQAARPASHAKKVKKEREKEEEEERETEDMETEEQEEEEEEEEQTARSYSPLPLPVVTKPRTHKGGRSPYNDEGEGADDGYVDPRFYQAPAPAPAPLVARPFAAATTSSPPRRLSWGDPTSYIQSFWRRDSSSFSSGAAAAVPDSPSKRVAFRDEIEEISHEEGKSRGANGRRGRSTSSLSSHPPPYASSSAGDASLRARRSSAAAAGSSSSNSSRRSSTSAAVHPAVGSPRGIIKKRDSAGAAGSRAEATTITAGRISFPSSIHFLHKDQKNRPSETAAATAKKKTLQERLRDLYHRAGMVCLGITIVALWLLVLYAVVYLTYAFFYREKCPPGQVREKFFGLVGECAVSTSTVRRLVRDVQKRTVQDVCWTMPLWGNPYVQEGFDETLPRYSIDEVWGYTGMLDFPWRDLDAYGVEREWRASLNDVFVHLRGRPELTSALWCRWAFLCRFKLFLAEKWSTVLLLFLLVLSLAYARWISRRRLRERRQAELLKRIIIDLLATEGEMPPEHARDELLHGLATEYRHLNLSRAGLKQVWPRAVQLVEKDSRVTKAQKEKHGRVRMTTSIHSMFKVPPNKTYRLRTIQQGIPHWVWMGRKLSSSSASSSTFFSRKKAPLDGVEEEKGRRHDESQGRGGDATAKVI